MILNPSKLPYFYKITNKINGMFYYGSGMCDKYTGSGRFLKEEQLKFGFDAFEYEILKHFNTREDAFEFENRFLTLYKISSLDNSYNLTSHARGGNHGEKANQKRSLTLKKIRNEKPLDGLNNPRADRNLYDFYNIKTGERLTSTVYDMNQLTGAKACMFGYVVRGNRKIYKDWILYSNIEKWGTKEKLKAEHKINISKVKTKSS
jgi:hypothetical protein